eukprot:286789_1
MQRRKTRMQYRALAEYTDEHRALILNPMSHEFSNTLRKQDVVYEDVGHIQEMHLDMRQSVSMTNILNEQCRTLGDEQFPITPHDYVNATIRSFAIQNDDTDSPTQVDWNAIGDKLALWYLTVPAIQFMNGALQQSQNTQSKKRHIVRRKSKHVAQGPVVKPKKVVRQETMDKTETKSRIENLRKTLKSKCRRQDGVNPFEFLINPSSYSQTIENIFDLSFVVKEGCGQMMIDDMTKQPVLSYVTK